MTRNLLRAGALCCALLTSTCLTPSPALAQTQTPQIYRAPDANGVDLTHGDFLLNMVEGAIGSGEGELALVRTGVSQGSGNSSHNWDQLSLTAYVGANGFPSSFTVTHGNRFEQFDASGASRQRNGASVTSLGVSYEHVAADGTTTTFTNVTGVPAAANFCNGAEAEGSQCMLLPSQIVTPDGKAVTLEWDSWVGSCSGGTTLDDPQQCAVDTRLARVTNSYGYRIEFAYAAGGTRGQVPPSGWHRRTHATFHNDRRGGEELARVTYAYDEPGVVKVTDTGGNLWRVASSGSRVTAIRRPGATADSTIIGYAADGRVASVTNGGVTTSYTRTVSGSTAIMTVKRPLTQPTIVTSDLNVGRPVIVENAPSQVTRYAYDSYGRLTRVTAPEGDDVGYEHDARGNVVRVVRTPKNDGGPVIETRAEYDDAVCANPATCNLPSRTIDARGGVTDYHYDELLGLVSSITGPAPTPGAARPQTRYHYAPTDSGYLLSATAACRSGEAPACVGTAAETVLEIGYDANANVVSTTMRASDNSVSATSVRTYTPLGDVETVDGPLPGTADTMRMRYNSARQLVGTASADPDGTGPLQPRAVRTSYLDGLVIRTEAGNVTGHSDAAWNAFAPAQSAVTAYDEHARPVAQRLIGSDGAAYALTQTSYDLAGRVDCTAQRMNVYAFGTLPASACTTGPEMGHGPDRITRTLYDALGRPVEQRVAVGTAVEAAEVRATYTLNGQVETLTDGENNTTAYEYDGHDRLSITRYPVAQQGAQASSASDYEQLGYDAAGNVVSRRLRDGQVVGYGYDALSRLTAKDRPGAEPDASYGYDLLGRLTSAGEGGHSITLEYDALGRRVREVDSAAGNVDRQLDAAGRVTQLTAPYGYFLAYDHLVTGEMTHVRGNDEVANLSFGYDQQGRRTSLTRGNGAVTSYGYHPSGLPSHLGHHIPRPGQALWEPFSYFEPNAAGQIINVVRNTDDFTISPSGGQATPADGLNRLVNVNGTPTQHDGRGNMTGDGLGRTYAYDSDNRLVASGSVSLRYDPLGRLHEVTGPAGTRRMTYDGDRLIQVTSPGLVEAYVHGPGTDEPLMQYAAGGLNYLHADERGSITALSGAGGDVTAINRYDEYGVVQGGLSGRFGFTGQQYLPEIGLHYYRARMYHQDLSRFMQTDPIGYRDGMNLHAYVAGDPVNRTDPSGLCWVSPDECVVTGSRGG